MFTLEIRLSAVFITDIGRKEATRTPDPYVPNVVRYQLRYFPIGFLFVGAKVGIFFGLTKCLLLFHQHMHDDFCILGVVGNQKEAAASE